MFPLAETTKKSPPGGRPLAILKMKSKYQECPESNAIDNNQHMKFLEVHREVPNTNLKTDHPKEAKQILLHYHTSPMKSFEDGQTQPVNRNHPSYPEQQRKDTSSHCQNTTEKYSCSFQKPPTEIFY